MITILLLKMNPIIKKKERKRKQSDKKCNKDNIFHIQKLDPSITPVQWNIYLTVFALITVKLHIKFWNYYTTTSLVKDYQFVIETVVNSNAKRTKSIHTVIVSYPWKQGWRGLGERKRSNNCCYSLSLSV